MHTWHWSEWQGLPYLHCSLLQDWPHGFFTQQFWPKTPTELSPILSSTATVYRVKQVHGNCVLAASDVEPVPTSPDTLDQGSEPDITLCDADGLLTQRADQSIWVCSADCTPALVGDVRTGQVAAVHAGWRGTAAKILPQAIAQLCQQGSQIVDLRIALGPAISGETYQVDLDVAATVGASFSMNLQQSAEGLIQELQALTDPPLLPDVSPEKVRLDVRRVNALQLEYLGIQPEQITIAPACTYQQPEFFFSYRRDGLKKVQWSGIVSRSTG
jgi:polyphenol oxidase